MPRLACAWLPGIACYEGSCYPNGRIAWQEGCNACGRCRACSTICDCCHSLHAGLPRSAMLELVETIKFTDLKSMAAGAAAALLVLAAAAGLQPDAPIPQACCTALKRHLRQLRCAWQALLFAWFAAPGCVGGLCSEGGICKPGDCIQPMFLAPEQLVELAPVSRSHVPEPKPGSSLLPPHMHTCSLEQLRQARTGLLWLHGGTCDDELLASIEGRLDAMASLAM